MIKQNQETCDDLKEIIERNREEYKEKADGIIESLNKLSDHVATANGRTTKNELAIAHLEGIVNTQIAMCEARNEGRLSGHCGVQ
jgi:F0F1-type ATP synthase membrane subunit b/b'